ncbi:hypothetical protein SSPO_091180 [Streptomyces antimycoticus]|uniref:HTH luxR-type domain-containing protein n=1 Tax=Streptomyces antimycoticus TaxID=68175 RepID=A0A499V0K2_9ACTN|nr:hypothetical protein SSPO_091180 [Streptomyces antimycoticus]
MTPRRSLTYRPSEVLSSVRYFEHTAVQESPCDQWDASDVGGGRSNAEIARELHLALPTVKAHVSRILTRLDLNNRVQIALLVHDAGESYGG